MKQYKREDYLCLSDEEYTLRDSFIKESKNHLSCHYNAITIGEVPRRKIPELFLSPGESSYNDTKEGIIEIGVGTLDGVYEKAPTFEERYYLCKYLMGHEVEHARATTEKAWNNALTLGTFEIVKRYLLRIGEKVPIGAVSEEYQKKLLQKIRENGNPAPSYEEIMQFTHYVVNVTEDGRIDRERAGRIPSYRKAVKFYRGMSWLKNPVKEEALSKNDILDLRMNLFLSLSTLRIFPKNFVKNYSGTEEEDFALKLIPHISKAVYSVTCRKGMEEAVKLCGILADTYIDAFLESGGMGKKIASYLSDLPAEDTPSSNQREKDEFRADSYGEAPLSEDNLEEPEISDEGTLTGNLLSEKIPKEGGEEKENISEAGKMKNEKGSNLSPRKSSVNLSEEEIEKEMEDALEREREEGDYKGNVFSGEDINPNPDIIDLTLGGIGKDYDLNIKFSEFTRKYDVTEKIPDAVLPAAKMLKEKVSKFFSEEISKFSKRKTSGKLDTKAIWRIGRGDADIFKRRRTPEKFSGASYILVDNSGSMGAGFNSKRMFALEACAIVEYGFSSFMPLKIAAFDSDGGDQVCHEIIKNWGERFNASSSMSFFRKGRTGYSNEDYNDIRIAGRELLSRPEKRKILVVISDGLPCPGNEDEDPCERVREEVNLARAKGITVVGIYISDVILEKDRRKYTEMYGESCVFTDTDHIGEKLIDTISLWTFAR